MEFSAEIEVLAKVKKKNPTRTRNMDRLGVPRPHTDAFILTGPSQEPAYIAWVLCRRPRAADCI